MLIRKCFIGALVVALVVLGAAPANAANPYNAKGYMNVPGDYAGVYVESAGAGVIAVRAFLNYTAPGAGLETWETLTRKRTSPAANYVVTTGYPDSGLQYNTIVKFKGCSGSGTDCTLGAWDSNAAPHTFK